VWFCAPTSAQKNWAFVSSRVFDSKRAGGDSRSVESGGCHTGPLARGDGPLSHGASCSRAETAALTRGRVAGRRDGGGVAGRRDGGGVAGRRGGTNVRTPKIVIRFVAELRARHDVRADPGPRCGRALDRCNGRNERRNQGRADTPAGRPSETHRCAAQYAPIPGFRGRPAPMLPPRHLRACAGRRICCQTSRDWSMALGV